MKKVKNRKHPGQECNCRFSYAGTWELVNLFVGTKNFSYHICYENRPKTEQNTYSEVKTARDRQTMDRQN